VVSERGTTTVIRFRHPERINTDGIKYVLVYSTFFFPKNRAVSGRRRYRKRSFQDPGDESMKHKRTGVKEKGGKSRPRFVI